MLPTTSEVKVLCASETLSIPEIGAWAERLWPLMRAEMSKYGLAQSGPTTFVSYGREGPLSHAFRHDFCIPVSGDGDYGGALKLTTLPAVEHASAWIEGPFTPESLERAYTACLDRIRGLGRTPSGESREVYHLWSGPDSPDNRVEIIVACQ
jgi:effector-binding domain-containing protein